MDLIANTATGPVAGRLHNGVRKWLGIPYARAERFCAPSPYPPWTEPRPAKSLGAQCPQHFAGSAKNARLRAPDFDEDCLLLNIYAPQGAEENPKPVFVWVHGGAFLVGASNQYDGADLARQGDMIVVTINYRVGVLGFVNFGEALGLRDMPSNLGLRDQIAALTWIRDNIAAFGGDPARVTLAGQSAGSMSVSLLMVCRQAWPLFHQAIMQSGALNLIHNHDTSVRIAHRYADILDLNQSDGDSLRKMDLSKLFEAQAIIGKEERGGLPAAPWYDGDLLPASLADAHRHPTPPTPLLAGATREETRLFEILPGDILPTKRKDLEALIRAQLPAEHAERILAAYPKTSKGQRALATDLTFAMPTRNFAERHAAKDPTWFYRFDYANPVFGAAHGLDLLFLFAYSNFRAFLARGGPLSGRHQALAQRMHTHWARFVHHGAPLDDWPAYTSSSRTVRLFNLEDSVTTDPDAERFAAWNGADVGLGMGAPPREV